MLLQVDHLVRQDLSVAGKRAGLAGERSGLFMEQMRIVKEMRNESRRKLEESGAVFSVRDVKPRYLVWENVCGAFSSGNPAGSDFAAVLEEIARVVVDEIPNIPIPEQGWSYSGCIEGMGDEGMPFSICWRTHDSQYWGKAIIDNSGRVVGKGTPQRRRRISLVADFGGNTAPEILFEQEGMSGNLKQSGAKGETTSGATSDSLGASGTVGDGIRDGRGNGRVNNGQCFSDVSATLTADDGSHGFHSQKMSSPEENVVISEVMCFGNGQINDAVSPDTEVSKTLNCLDDPMKIVVNTSKVDDSEPMTVYDWHRQDTRATELKDVCTTVSASYGAGGNNMPYVIHKNGIEGSSAIESHPQDSRVSINPNDINQTLSSNMEHDPANGGLVMQTPSVNILNPDDSQGSQIADSDGVYPTLRGCGGGGYQAGYMLDKPVAQQGVDIYNGKITGDKTAPLTCNSNATSTQPLVMETVQNEPILLESNQNHATVQTNGVSTSLPASMGEGGGYVPMVVDDGSAGVKQIGCDVYNHTVTGEVAVTLTPDCGNTNTIGPKVIVEGFDSYNQTSTGEVAKPLTNKATDTDHIPVVYEVSVAPKVDTEKLIKCLQVHKKQASIKNIAKTLNVPKATVEKWFKKDTGFAIPSADVWMKLKELLKIDTDEFDNGIMGIGINPEAIKHPQIYTSAKASHFTSANGNDIAETLVATDYKEPQLVAYGFESDNNIQNSAGFCTEHSAKAHGIGYEKENAPTLRGSVVPAVVYDVKESKSDRIACATPTAKAVAYGISPFDSNAMKSPNPNSGIYKADTARTLDLNGGNPACNQGGMAIVQGADVYNGDLTGDVAPSVTTKTGEPGSSGPKAVVYAQADGCLNPWDVQSKHIQSENGTAEPLYAGEARYGGGESYVLQTSDTTAFTQNQREEVRDLGDVATSVTAESGTHQQTYVAHTFKKDSHAKTSEDGQGWVPTDVNDTLNAFDQGESRTPTLVVEESKEADGVIAFTPDSEVKTTEDEVAFSMLSRDYKDPQCVAIDMGGGKSQCGVLENQSPTLTTTHYGEPAVCYGIDQQGGKGQANFTENVAPTLAADSHGTPHATCYDAQETAMAEIKPMENTTANKITPTGSVVRRLTPLECERLQGFPDNWTNIGSWRDFNGKMHKDSDSPRYKALGNSICLPYWVWMAGRMCRFLRDSGITNPKMASLFDGIGGFPLAYSIHGCEPVWASEIEDFPIAVTKVRFAKGMWKQYIGTGLPYLVDTVSAKSNNLGSVDTEPDQVNVCYGLDRASFNQGQNAKYDFSIEEDKAQTLVSKGPGGVMTGQ